MYYEDGSIYEGEWLEDQRNGSGMLRLGWCQRVLLVDLANLIDLKPSCFKVFKSGVFWDFC